MEQRPEQRPEGKLIAAAADRMNLSIREAARRAGISYGRWRQIVTGYQNVSPGSYAEVRAPAKTLAKMALTVGITPEQMETEGQRPDAAEILREILRQQADSRAAAPQFAPPRRERRLKALEVSDPAELEPFLQDVRREVYTAAGIIGMFPPGADLPGPEDLPELEALLDDLPGEVAFPGSPTEPAIWETRDRLSVPERIRLVARIRHMSAKHGSGQQDRSVSGLTPAWRDSGLAPAWHDNGADGAVPAERHQAGVT